LLYCRIELPLIFFWNSLCCANSPGNLALYVPPCRDSSAHSFALQVGRLFHLLSPAASLPLRSAFRQNLTIPPLPSANTFVNVFRTLTGFMHRGLSPHKFTPMPRVHNSIKSDGKKPPRLMLGH